MSELAGRLIGERYLIEQVVARGGMATVYLAEDQRLDRKVALKVIHPHLASDASFRDKFIREAKMAAKLSHPNLVNVFDQGEDAEVAFLTMEYVPGITMRDALKDFGSLDAKRALDLFEPMLSGLAAAHRAGVLHRDLKPENILLADDGRIKLGDFGLARDIANNTSTGSLVGTVAYLSPELVTRGVADARSDVYAAGIILFELLTGRQPYQGEQAVQIAYQHANENVPAPSTLNPEIPPIMDELVLWATARDAAHRPHDASEFLEVVQRARKELGNRNATLSLGVLDQNKTTVMASTTFADQTQVLDSFDLDDNATAVLHQSTGGAHNATEVIGRIDSLEDEPTELEKLGGRRRALNVLITTLLVVLLGAGAGWWFSSGPGGFAAVPDLTSRSITDAQAALKEIHATTTVVEESSTTVTKGLVIRTEPAKGSLFFGGDIKLIVSSGPKLIAVPKLTGMNLAEATAALMSTGFQLGKVSSWFNAAPIGQVFDYLGSDGSAIPQASAIELQISLGAIPVVAGIDQAVAISALEAAGLQVTSITQEFSDTIASGQVISAIPTTEPIGKDGEVTLVVSKGPNIVIMPRVIGETILAAKSILETMGLRVTVDTNQIQSRWGIAKVKSASAAEGTQLRFGDNVTIVSR